MSKHIKFFSEITNNDVALVGGKNASLGEMYQKLTSSGIKIPNGFAITADGYDYFLKSNNLEEKIKNILNNLDIKNIRSLQQTGEQIRSLIKNGKIPEDLKNEILSGYINLRKEYGEKISVAIRSSATAEDLPTASFAGQQETFLNIIGEQNLLQKVKDCFASLFTDRAISYRIDKGFGHFQVKLSVGIQKMIRADIGSSGVLFTIEPDTGLNNVIVISSIFGLGELIVQGKIAPDEFIVFKQGLEKNFNSIIEKKLGDKFAKIIYTRPHFLSFGGQGGENQIKQIRTTEQEKKIFSLSDEEAIELAHLGLLIEKHYGKAMDIEWAKDGIDKKIYIVQARPETVHSSKDKNIYLEYKLKSRGDAILTGVAVGSKIASGKVKIIKSAKEIEKFKKGEILVTEMTDPDWEPIMKIASGIITEKGGRTAHAAIVSRELGIPCIVGVAGATNKLKDSEEITIDCSAGSMGKIYKGKLEYEITENKLAEIPKTKTKVMVNIGSPDEAWEKYYLPVKGIGLAREEFIIAGDIGIHPNALIEYQGLKTKNAKVKTTIEREKLTKLIKKIDELTIGYENKTQFYIDKLATGIAKIATAFYPAEVIVRFSDFKTNEYKNLLGGEFYEPEESNPMIGWRGASRYYDEKFKQAFELEVLAIKKAVFEFGLDNIAVMIPFCRTPAEGKKILNIISQIIPREKIKIYVMAEIPSNVILGEEFLELFDGFSIGSNDLTQLIMGIDRDSEIIAGIANENNPAVKNIIAAVIKIAKEKGKYLGICGQAPSDIPGFVEFLVEEGIESISVNPDVVIQTIKKVAAVENRL